MMSPADKFKYQRVVDILLSAEVDETPHSLAARVRRLAPSGVYASVRICEDIDHIIRRDGCFSSENVALSSQQRLHVIKLKDAMLREGTWMTRRTRGALKEVSY